MKIKTDFVTNSSSVSYVGWGIYMEEEDLMKNEKFLKKCFENFKVCDSDGVSFEEFKDYGIYEILEHINSKDGILTFSGGPYGENYFILGKSSDLKDDQTLKEFKEQIKKELKELGIDKDIKYIEECWRDD